MNHSVPADSAVPGESVAGESVAGGELGESVPAPSDVVRARVVLPIDAAALARVVRALEEQVEALGCMQTVGLSGADRRGLVVRMETVGRALFGMSHTWIADLIGQGDLDDIYGSVPDALAVLLGISRARARQRVRYAEQFGERTAISGERLDPVSVETAWAAEEGVLDEEHQDIVRKFFRRLGGKVDLETQVRAERQLAQLARELLPDQFAAAARRLYDTVDPDGDISDEQIAEQTYFRFGEQDSHGLSKISGRVDAELRAYLDAVFAKFAKPGMCNPADPNPVVDEPAGQDPGADGSGGHDGHPGKRSVDGPSLFDEPAPCPTRDDEVRHDDDEVPHDDDEVPNDKDSARSCDGNASGKGPDLDGPDAGDGSSGSGTGDGSTEAEVRAARDVRGQGRRQHDALKVVVRQMLASGKLGRHRGLPVTAVVSMTLKELESGCGHAVTATGSLVRMRDAIRMASHARHYLAVFDDDGRPLYLGRSKRIASEDQRIVLMAADRGCTFPGCTRPATWSQVHHIDEWADGGDTDIDSLTFGCDQHHALVGTGDTEWATTKAGPEHAYPGRTLWHAPAVIDPSRQGRVNHFHHPNEYIYPSKPGSGAVPRPRNRAGSNRPSSDSAEVDRPEANGPEPGASPA